MQVAEKSSSPNVYDTVNIYGGVVQLGDQYFNVQRDGPTPEKVAHLQFLSSLRYPEMTMRLREIGSNKFDTFEWFFENKLPTSPYNGPLDQPMPDSVRVRSKAERLMKSASAAPPYFRPSHAKFAQIQHDKARINAMQQQSSAFAKWLKHDDGFFLIQGKPGSGKSTFMKFLFEHKATTALLRQWCSTRRFNLLFHSFWSPGRKLQRSQKGFLASLIWQLVSDNTQLLQVCKGFPLHMRHSLDDWSESELSSLLTQMLTHDDYRTCLFVDGLDEMHSADDIDSFDDFYELLDKLAGHHGCKICVSSRPEPHILQFFQGAPLITLQDLTSNDIYTYTHRTLAEQVKKRPMLTRSNGDVESLAQTICDRAQGVFLWVHYVLTNVCRGFMGFDSVTDLMKRVEELPSRVEELYKQMWDTQNTIHSVHSTETRTIFRMGKYFPMPLFQLANVLDASFYNEYIENARPPDQKQLADYCSDFASRLSARTAGLVEVTVHSHGRDDAFSSVESTIQALIDGQTTRWKRMKVQFFHRTVHDYLRDNGLLNSGATGDTGALDAPCDLLWIQSYLTCMAEQVLPLTMDTIFDLCLSSAWSNEQCLPFINVVDDFCYKLVCQRQQVNMMDPGSWLLQLQTTIDWKYPIQFIDFASLMAASNSRCLEYLLTHRGTHWSPYYKGHLARAIVVFYIGRGHQPESPTYNLFSSWRLLRNSNADLESLHPYVSADGFLAIRSPAGRLVLESCLILLQRSSHVMLRLCSDELLEALNGFNLHEQYLTLFWHIEGSHWSAGVDSENCVAFTFDAGGVCQVVLDALKSHKSELKLGQVSKPLFDNTMRQLKHKVSLSLLKLSCKIHLSRIGHAISGHPPQPSFYRCPAVHEKQILDVVFGRFQDAQGLWEMPSLYEVPTNFAYDIDFGVEWIPIAKYIRPLDPEQNVSAGEWMEKGILREYFAELSKDEGDPD